MKRLIFLVIAIFFAFAGCTDQSARIDQLEEKVAGCTGNIYNIKLLSDNMVDWTDLDSFIDDATDNWTTNDEKFEAIAYWISKCGQQQSVHWEHDKAVTDPAMFFNSYGGTNCGIWTAILCTIADYGMHDIDSDWRGIYREYGSHTIGSIWYDSQEHLYDGTHKLYTYESDGKTVCDTWGYGSPDYYIYDYCPFATGKDYDGSGSNNNYFVGGYNPNGATLNGRVYYGNVSESDEGKGEIRHWAEHAFKYHLGLRIDEYYTRYSEPLGFTSEYYRPVGREVSGSDPDTVYSKYNIRGNGKWVYDPDFSSDSFLYGVYSTSGITTGGSPKIHPTNTDVESSIIFKVQPANVVTGASLVADIVRGSNDSLTIEYSIDLGNNWETISSNPSTGELSTDFNSMASNPVGKGGIYNYLVRVRMTAVGSATDVGIDSFKLETITMVNRKALPNLLVGRNYITVDIGDQYETNTLWPAICSYDGNTEFYKDYAVDYSSNLTWDNSGGDRTWYRALSLTDTGEGYVVFQIDTPNDIKKIRMSGRLRTLYDNDYIKFQYRLGTSGDWTTIDTLSHDDVINSYLWEQTPSYEVNISQEDKTTVQFRYLIHVETMSSGSYSASAGLISAYMEADYLSNNTDYPALEVTYNWTEYWGDNSSITPDTRQHTERISEFPHSYYVNVGGNYDPTTNWVRVNFQGSAPEEVTVGYSDETDYGSTYDVTRYKYFYGELISRGCSYSSSQSTNTTGHSNLADEGSVSLTDGYSISANASTDGVDFTELAGYSNDPEFIIDLGMIRTIGGFRVDNYRYEDEDCYSPESFSISVSENGSDYDEVGTVTCDNYSENWPEFWPRWKSWDMIRYNPGDNASPPDPRAYGLWAMYWHVIPAFTLNARYVKFTFTNPSGKRIALADLRVYDTLERNSWDAKHKHSD